MRDINRPSETRHFREYTDYRKVPEDSWPQCFSPAGGCVKYHIFYCIGCMFSYHTCFLRLRDEEALGMMELGGRVKGRLKQKSLEKYNSNIQ